MYKKSLTIGCVVILLGGSLYWGYSNQQKVDIYENHLSSEMANDYVQLAGSLEEGEGLVSVVLQEKQIAKEEQEYLINDLNQTSFVLSKYNNLAFHLNKVDLNVSLEKSSDTIMAIRSFIANLQVDIPLTKVEMEKLQVSQEVLKGMNNELVENFPELHEGFDSFYSKYDKESIKGEEWKDILVSALDVTKQVSEREGIDNLPHYFTFDMSQK